MVRFLSVLLALLLMATTVTFASAKPLTEKGLAALVEAGFEEEEIVAKVKKDGVDFEVNEESLARLKQAGLSDKVLETIQSAKKPAAAGTPAITFEQIITLLSNGIDEETIMAKLKKSPSIFTLSADQEKELRDAGATDTLIAAMTKPRAAEEAAEPISDLAIVLDVSGSMKEATPDGPSKMEVAREVVGELIEKIPAGLNVTLVVYGHRAGCSAVQALRPLSELKESDKQGLITTVAKLQPVGNTPIALALRRTGEQFAGRKSYCGVVLITDGLESCKGDPAAEAAKLAENPFLRFGVNVVGFGLKDDENEGTAAIAASGKGKYYAASDREELLAAINDVTKKLEQGAKPAAVAETAKKGRRAIVVLKPGVEFPAVTEICTAEPSASYSTLGSYKLNAVTEFGKEIRQPSADPVDVWIVPADGLAVRLVAKFENPEREIRELRLEDLLGLVRVTSATENPEAIVVITSADGTNASTVNSYKLQESKGFNKDMIVAAGTYNVWVWDPADKEYTLLEQDLEVLAGEVTPVER